MKIIFLLFPIRKLLYRNQKGMHLFISFKEFSFDKENSSNVHTITECVKNIKDESEVQRI